MLKKLLKQSAILLLAAAFLASCKPVKQQEQKQTSTKKQQTQPTVEKQAKTEKEEESPVLVRLNNGDVITWKDLDDSYRVGRMRMRLTEDQVKRLLDNLVKERLVYLDGVEKGYDKDPEYISQLERQKMRLMNSIVMRKLSRESTEITEDELNKYYKEHPEKFHIRKVEYVIFSPRKFGNDKAKAKSEAEKALAAIKKGMTLEEVSKKFLNRPRPFAINLREAQHSFFGKDFDEAAWKLKKGEVSDLIETSQGYLIVQMVDDKHQTLEEARGYLQSILRREKSSTRISTYYDSLKKKYGVQVDEEALKSKLSELKQSWTPIAPPSPKGVPPTVRPSGGKKKAK